MRYESVARVVALVSIMLVAGCASSAPLGTTEKTNLEPFADFTVALLAKSDYGLLEDEIRLTREYIDYEAPEVAEYIAIKERIEQSFESILAYSLNVVALSDRDLTDAQQVEEYADFVLSLRDRITENTEITEDDYEEILADVRAQKKLLDAMRAAQPLIDAASNRLQALFVDLDARALEITDQAEKDIDADYAAVILFAETLQTEKDTVLAALIQVFAARSGEESAANELAASPVLGGLGITVGPVPTVTEMAEVEHQLVDRLRHLNDARAQIEDDMRDYIATFEELDEVLATERDMLAEARAGMVIWARAHEKMASGIKNPAKWFEYLSLPLKLYRAAK